MLVNILANMLVKQRLNLGQTLRKIWSNILGTEAYNFGQHFGHGVFQFW